MTFWIKNSARMSTVLKDSVLIHVCAAKDAEIGTVNVPLRRDLNYDGPFSGWFPLHDGKGQIKCTLNYAVGTA